MTFDKRLFSIIKTFKRNKYYFQKSLSFTIENKSAPLLCALGCYYKMFH